MAWLMYMYLTKVADSKQKIKIMQEMYELVFKYLHNC